MKQDDSSVARSAGPMFGLDASGKTAGVCLLGGRGETLFQRTLNEGLTHSQTLLPLVDDAFAAAGLAPADLRCFAVTVGPGSFTGLRIGLGLVKGLAMPANIPVVPVSTLLALALATAEAGYEGIVLAALDARRGEVYAGLFECAEGGCRRLLEDTAGPAEKIMKKTWKITKKSVWLVGDGAQMCYNASMYGQTGLLLPAAERPSAARGAALAALQTGDTGGWLPAAETTPEYLRLSQAERERMTLGQTD